MRKNNYMESMQAAFTPPARKSALPSSKPAKPTELKQRLLNGGFSEEEAQALVESDAIFRNSFVAHFPIL